jgi:hypothetical protein
MNKSIITHGAWLAVAAGAFATGITLKSNTSSTAENKVEVNVTEGDKLSALAANPSPDLDTSPTGDQNRFAVTTITKSPAELLDALANSDDPIERNFIFAQLLLGLTADNAASLHASLKDTLSGRDGARQMSLLFRAWGKIDGATAIAAATESDSDAGDRGGRRGPGGFNTMSALSSWATTDSTAAIAWLGDVEDGREKSMYTFGLINGLAKTDADSATDYVLELAAAKAAGDAEAGDGGQRGGFGDLTSRYISQIANEQIKKGIDTAVDWADALPDGDLKSSAFDQIADSYARSDIDAAKEWVAEYADQDYAQRAVAEVADRLASIDPQAAVDWAASLPESAQASAYAQTLEQWTRDDATAASEYLATMQPSDTRDAAVSSFATELDREDPASAATWAATIADVDTRISTLTKIAQSWMRSDADAAKAWLPSSGLPQETQTQIIATPARPERGGFRGGR